MIIKDFDEKEILGLMLEVYKTLNKYGISIVYDPATQTLELMSTSDMKRKFELDGQMTIDDLGKDDE